MKFVETFSKIFLHIKTLIPRSRKISSKKYDDNAVPSFLIDFIRFSTKLPIGSVKKEETCLPLLLRELFLYKEIHVNS